MSSLRVWDDAKGAIMRLSKIHTIALIILQLLCETQISVISSPLRFVHVSTFRFSSTLLSPSLHSLNPPFLLLITLSFPSLLPFKRDSPLLALQYLALLLSFTFCPSFLIICLLIFIPLCFFSVFYSLSHFPFVPHFSTLSCVQLLTIHPAGQEHSPVMWWQVPPFWQGQRCSHCGPWLPEGHRSPQLPNHKSKHLKLRQSLQRIAT